MIFMKAWMILVFVVTVYLLAVAAASPILDSTLRRVGFTTLQRQLKSRGTFSKNLVYYGGPVLQSATVNPIFIGPIPDSKRLLEYYAFLVKSPLAQILNSEYSTSTAQIGYGRLGTPYVEKDPLITGAKTLDDDNDILPYLFDLIVNGIIWPSPNSYFPIYTQPGVTVTQQGSKSCIHFCGYHGTFDISDLGIPSTPYLYYAVIADQSGTCMGGCGISRDPFENLCSVSSHEFTESVTNPAVSYTNSRSPAAPMGWFSPSNYLGGEVADICNAMQSTLIDPLTGKSWVVQQVWSNKNVKCMASDPRLGGTVQSTVQTSATTVTSKRTTTLLTTKTWKQ
ncbi:hypothetical protein BCR33DRAFT_591468 [Rhizoclosmatium globosum]|uniref:Uncharacterized protein n=1 Tax=Rhizoclosmatium globosum TaxID=329046 RepID=A0A1Y2B2G9_9FUNG|nr:hypothetical protein BCR33DRAFT_591468 [Rhizoclosmatium globosum]|eukprot:ORY28750.1 hypothetical protein BCR33DRAFT_591468 [Rhizoclosmatium globosum]